MKWLFSFFSFFKMFILGKILKDGEALLNRHDYLDRKI